MRVVIGFWCCLSCVVALGPDAARAETVEQWGVFELALHGPTDGNPFVEVTLDARFECDGASVTAAGFYDDDGTYRIRFMPQRQGVWRYQTRSNRTELNDRTGEFTCTAPPRTNHGTVRVRNVYHFAFADGTPYVPIGTTCYAWIHQPEQLQSQTLATLKTSPFNKVRMCVLPTRTPNKQLRLPFETSPDGRIDLTRFNVSFFHNLEQRIAQLADLGIEADLILFHPYDGGQWGFDQMDAASDDRYLRYVVARLAAYRNVWWSLANEFDLMNEKSDSDWDRFFQIVAAEDPYGHLRSIHHSQRMYDVTKPWPTHLSVQNGIAAADFGRGVLYRQIVHKPIVFDEVKYEGNSRKRWGQLTPEELVQRFWMGTIAGTYVGHGEVLIEPGKPTWLSAGGELRGRSPARIAFLKQILATAPPDGIEPIDPYYETHVGGKPGEFYLIYFGQEKPTEWVFELPRFGLSDDVKFRVDVIDTWDMSITSIPELVTIAKHSEYACRANPERKIGLPGKPYMALRIVRVRD